MDVTMGPERLITFAPLTVLLVLAATIDLRCRRIPNWLTLMIAATGLAQSCTPHGSVGPVTALLGLAAGFGLTFGLFALGAVGGGDVKLLAGIGAWVGPAVFWIFVVEKLVGLAIVLMQCAWAGRLQTLWRNCLALLMNLAHVRVLGVDQAKAAGSAFRSVDRPMPYAVPVLLATLLVVFAWGIA